jgi:lipopolysaccharide export system protein LptA
MGKRFSAAARAALLVCAGLVAMAPPVLAQGGQGSCDLVASPGSEMAVYNRDTPYQVAHISRPILSCPNSMRITADSAVHTSAINEVMFYGSVRFSDPTRRLNADVVQYLTQQRQISAQGNAVLVDVANGSTIRSPTLNYIMESPTQPVARVEVYSGRPRTTLVGTARAGEPVDTTVVDSDALTIIGEHTFIGRGNVILRRGDLEGRGTLLNYDPTTGAMQLAGNARMHTDEFQLAGDTVRAEVTQDTIRHVLAIGRATLVAEDVNVEGPSIRIDLEQGELHRLVVLGAARMPIQAAVNNPAAASGITEAGQARVTSADFLMIADSIDALAPGRLLERVVAVGNARGERLPADSAARAEAESLPDVIAHDWVRGDTIIAEFIADTGPAGEAGTEPAVTSAGSGERVLETLTVLGGETPASSAYRFRDAADPGGGLTINYLLAQRIRVDFAEGEVKRLEAEGQITGLYLRPAVAGAGSRGAPPRSRP